MKTCATCKSPAKCKAAGMCLAKNTAKAAMGGPMKYKEGGKLEMVEKGGKMVPSFAADGKGKMAKGGMAKMAKGGAFAKTYSGRSGDSAEFVTERGRSMSEGMKKMAEDKKKPTAKAKGGKMKAYKAGGKIDGCAMRGKTKGSMR